MRTQKQIAASRENGGKSYGAATAEGKDEYYARHPPASPEARCLLDQIVMCEWYLRRFDSVEGSLWDELFTASPQNLDACAYASSKATGRSPGSSTASTPPAAPSTPR